MFMFLYTYKDNVLRSIVVLQVYKISCHKPQTFISAILESVERIVYNDDCSGRFTYQTTETPNTLIHFWGRCAVYLRPCTVDSPRERKYKRACWRYRKLQRWTVCVPGRRVMLQGEQPGMFVRQTLAAQLNRHASSQTEHSCCRTRANKTWRKDHKLSCRNDLL